MEQEQPGLLESAPSKSHEQRYLEIFKLVSLSHRYKKSDPFLADPLIDLDVIRAPAYQYSRNAQDRFFAEPMLAFLFAFFSVNFPLVSASEPESIKERAFLVAARFVEEKCNEEENGDRLRTEMVLLRAKALLAMQGEEWLLEYFKY